jgi:hypothetical protein
VDRVGLEADAATATLTMDEDAFRAFYDRTARALWVPVADDGRRAGGRRPAAGVLHRLLRARVEFEARRTGVTVFRIAANLARDRRAAVPRLP